MPGGNPVKYPLTRMKQENRMKQMKQSKRGIQEVLTLAEVGAILRVSRVTAWRMATKGALKAFRAGKAWRVLRDDLDMFTSGRAR